MESANIMLNRRILFDGGMGTQIAARGLYAACPEMLLESDFEAIARIHSDYASSGATIVSTNTFGANPIKLSKLGLEKAAQRLNGLGVRAARQGAAGRALVALDMGPTGELLAPFGEMSFKEVYDAYFEQASSGKAAGADLAIIETMTSLREGKAAALAARDAGLPFVLSFTYEPNGRTLMGDLPNCCAAAAQALGALMLGSNCSGGPEQMLPIIEIYARSTHLPILCQPNAGLPIVENGVTRFPYSPENMLEPMRALIAAGADAIGGCCGTTPAHIAAFSGLEFGPRAHAAVPEAICSGRIAVRVDELGAIDALPALPLDEAGDFDGDAPALIVDVNEYDCESAIELMEGAASMVYAPMILRGGSADVLRSLLRAYPGVAGVIGNGELAAQCGAVAI